MFSPVEVKYKYFDSQDIRQALADREEISQIDEIDQPRPAPEVKIIDMKVKPTPKTETKPSPNPDLKEKFEVIPNDKPRWDITNKWGKCSRSCGKGISIATADCII